MPNIFEERKQIQPYEYPHLLGYSNAIWNAFWEPNHFVYDRDVRDFKVELQHHERTVVERSMIAIGVVENKVKTFWARLDQRLPKTEISDVGYVFAGNEVVHRRTYEFLLNLLGLGEQFSKVDEIPAMSGRSEYLSKYLKGVTSRSNKEFTKSLILFTLLSENCSLFSQFLIVSSFSKYKNVLKNFNKVISASALEEALHGKFGAEIINIIREENPEWFDNSMENKVRRSVRKAIEAEEKVINWIFEEGQLDFLSKEEVLAFAKSRLNHSLELIQYEPEFDVEDRLLVKSAYMETMLLTAMDIDFFDGKNTAYNKSKSFNEDNLWE